MKEVLRGKCIALNEQAKKEKISKINNLRFHIRKFEKEEQIKCKVTKRK